jgi:hypothetical protein
MGNLISDRVKSLLLKRYDYLVKLFSEELEIINKRMLKMVEYKIDTNKKYFYLQSEKTRLELLIEDLLEERLEISFPIGATIIHNGKKFTVHTTQGTVINHLNCTTDVYLSAEDGEFLELNLKPQIAFNQTRLPVAFLFF